MFERLTVDKKIIVSIANICVDTPLTIRKDSRFLSCAEFHNIVDWYTHDDHSGRQHWIIEMEGSYCFIKSSFMRYNKTVYLGAPNADKLVYMYTTKNQFTRWNIFNHMRMKNIYILHYVGDKFDPLSLQLIVSRYNEDVQWTSAYSNIATVYNKGSPETCYGKKDSHLNIQQLPNIGREGHTYLYHINDVLSKDTTHFSSVRYVFSQGDPFTHNITFLFAVDNYQKLKRVQPLGLVYLRELKIPPQSVEEKITIHTDFGLRYSTLEVDGNLRSHLFVDEGIENLNRVFRNRPEHRDFESMTLMDTFLQKSDYIYEKPIRPVLFTYSALFSVTHEDLRLFSSLQIRKFISTLLSIDLQGCEYGYILERLWLYLFNYQP
jgi:hypothetical protein